MEDELKERNHEPSKRSVPCFHKSRFKLFKCIFTLGILKPLLRAASRALRNRLHDVCGPEQRDGAEGGVPRRPGQRGGAD